MTYAQEAKEREWAFLVVSGEVGAYREVQLLIWSAFLDFESIAKPKQISSHLRPSIDS